MSSLRVVWLRHYNLLILWRLLLLRTLATWLLTFTLWLARLTAWARGAGWTRRARVTRRARGARVTRRARLTLTALARFRFTATGRLLLARLFAQTTGATGTSTGAGGERLVQVRAAWRGTTGGWQRRTVPIRGRGLRDDVLLQHWSRPRDLVCVPRHQAESHEAQQETPQHSFTSRNKSNLFI